MVKWSALAALLGCGPKSIPTVNGPFAIEPKNRRTASSNWYNNGGSPFKTINQTFYSLTYKGNPVIFGNPPMNEFWQAFFLKDAPKPAVLIGSQNMYLVSETNDQLDIQTLDEQSQDFATYQWLDTKNGQPGPATQVYMGDDYTGSKYLSGGHKLLINTKVVIDIFSLKTYPFDIVSWEKVKTFGGFHGGNQPALAMSPDGTQLVFMGSKTNPDKKSSYLYGLVIVNYLTGKTYSVPFDRTTTRLIQPKEANNAWISQYFEWKKEANDEEIMALKEISPPNWQGKIALDTDKDWKDRAANYYLEPVFPTMQAAFLDFIKSKYTLTNITSDPSEDITWINFQIEHSDFHMYFKPSDKKIGLSIGFGFRSEKTVTILESIAQDFDAALTSGQFQNHFTTFD